MPKVAVVVIGGVIHGVVAIFLDAIVNLKEILNIVTILKTVNAKLGQDVITSALKLMKKRVHDLSPYIK